METAMKCQECGSPLEGKVSKSGLITCAYCGAGYDMRETAPKGAQIARADFSGPELKGWRFGSTMHGRLKEGRWWITQDNDGLNHPLLVAPGSYDDFDVRLRFSFLRAEPADCVFLRGRGGPAGAMSLHLRSDGMVMLRWQMPDHQWQDILVSVHCPPYDPNDWWELRWVARGPRHQAYLNGTMVISTQHPQILHSGFLDLRIQTISPSVSVEVAELSLWEVH